MVGSPFSFVDRGGAGALVSWAEALSAVAVDLVRSVSAGVFWSSMVVASFVWFLLNDQIHPAETCWPRLFLIA